MRIIGGRLKGRAVLPPAGYKARPTTDFAREGLFNVLDNEYEFQDLKVLDLFGGTGAIAYEFSRGCASVTSVEKATTQYNFIRRVQQQLHAECMTVLKADVFRFIATCQRQFDVIFADPPYALEGLDTLPDRIFSQDILHPGCYFILEHGGEHSFTAHPRFKKEKVYGRVHFSFFE